MNATDHPFPATGPRHVAEWWGRNGFATTVHEMDMRPGGVWRARFARREASDD